MTNKTNNVDLSEPLINQRAVREMLGLSTSENVPQISLDSLVKIAVHLIKTKLADCDCDEDELVSLQLEYTLPHPIKPELIENNTLQWKQQPLEPISQELSDKELSNEASQTELRIVLAQKLPLPEEFLTNLAQRINEAIFAVQPTAYRSATSWQFRMNTSAQGEYRYSCDGNCGDNYSIYYRGTFQGCGGRCIARQDRPPI